MSVNIPPKLVKILVPRGILLLREMRWNLCSVDVHPSEAQENDVLRQLRAVGDGGGHQAEAACLDRRRCGPAKTYFAFFTSRVG
jgi:hypothetical protein